MAWTNWAAPVATFIGGQLSAFGLQWVQARWQYRHDQYKLQAARAEKRVDRREAFELETLRELHLALADMGRATTLILLSERAMGGDSESPNREFVQANNRVNALRPLVFDEGLRQLIDDVQGACVTSFAQIGDPLGRLKKPIDLLQHALDGLASRIREIHGND